MCFEIENITMLIFGGYMKEHILQGMGILCVLACLVACKTKKESLDVTKVKASTTTAQQPEYSIQKLGDVVTVKNYEGSLSALAQLQDVSGVVQIVFDSCSFLGEPGTPLKNAEQVVSVVLKSCVFDALDFLACFPCLEAVYAPHTVDKFPEGYEIDLTACKHLKFIDMFDANFHITFARIKALPDSLDVFSMYDAMFDETNLVDLQEIHPSLKFSLPLDKDEWQAKGLRFADFEDFQAANKKYNLGMK